MTAILALITSAWTGALALGWVIPATTGIAGAVVTLLFGGDWRMALIAAGTLAGAALAYRVLGLKGALAALAAGAVLMARRSGERAGAAAQAEKEKANADRAVDDAHRARADADRRNSEPGRLRDNDGWRRD